MPLLIWLAALRQVALLGSRGEVRWEKPRVVIRIDVYTSEATATSHVRATMTDKILKSFTSPNGRERILIVQRADGHFSYRNQMQDDQTYDGPGKFVFPEGYVEENGWLPPGPYLGVYFSADMAEEEAFCKVEWLKKVLSN